jgi:hypothetical protein
MTREAAGPLGGVTVLDLCSYLAGPYGCTLLADLGRRRRDCLGELVQIDGSEHAWFECAVHAAGFRR